ITHNRFFAGYELEVFRDACHLRVSVTGIIDRQRILWCARFMQPLMTVDSHVVCFFVCSHENANLNPVVFVGSQERCEWVARLHALSQWRIEVWLHIKKWIGT